MRSLLSCFLLAATTVSIAQPPHDDDAAVIERQSKKFSDASASGDAKTLEKYLDDAVVLMNEGGEIASKHDIVTGTTPPPAGVHNTLVQTDFTMHIERDVAVTSFTDNGTFNAYGQTYHGRFRSIEVWRRKQGRWLMISSQTLAASDDPPARRLPAAELDQYVGTYSAGPGLAVRISRDGDGLVSTTNDGKPAELRAEMRDVLFTPGQPRLRRVFERDTDGRITGFVSRREGRDCAALHAQRLKWRSLRNRAGVASARRFRCLALRRLPRPAPMLPPVSAPRAEATRRRTARRARRPNATRSAAAT